MSSGPAKRILRQSSGPNSPPAGVKINTLTPRRTAISDIIPAKYRRWGGGSNQPNFHRTFAHHWHHVIDASCEKRELLVNF